MNHPIRGAQELEHIETSLFLCRLYTTRMSVYNLRLGGEIWTSPDLGQGQLAQDVYKRLQVPVLNLRFVHYDRD